MSRDPKNAPGRVRDAIVDVLSASPTPLKVATIIARVGQRIGETPPSSIRSYLRLNTPDLFVREARGTYRARRNPSRQWQLPVPETGKGREKRAAPFLFRQSELYHDDCFAWLAGQPLHSLHAVVTDPPYGLHEYTREQQRKLRAGKGGVWRIPPSFDGHRRSPLPRFTTLDTDQLADIREFFVRWTRVLLPVLVPGANVIVASNPLVSPLVATALSEAGLERRGEIIRLTMTMRGGDRPKGAHDEFRDVSVMPRSMWEPWLVYRKPLDGRVQDNLRKWMTGGFRRPAPDKPFGDVIPSAPSRGAERRLAPHPSLKPQAFLRHVVRGVLPLGEGRVLDPFAGAGSTLAACNAVGYDSVGVERDRQYFSLAVKAIPKLTTYRVSGDGPYKPSAPGVS